MNVLMSERVWDIIIVVNWNNINQDNPSMVRKALDSTMNPISNLIFPMRIMVT